MNHEGEVGSMQAQCLLRNMRCYAYEIWSTCHALVERSVKSTTTVKFFFLILLIHGRQIFFIGAWCVLPKSRVLVTKVNLQHGLILNFCILWNSCCERRRDNLCDSQLLIEWERSCQCDPTARIIFGVGSGHNEVCGYHSTTFLNHALIFDWFVVTWE